MSVMGRIDMAAEGHERLVRMPELLQRTSLSRASIYRKMARGEFPTSVAIGANSTGWYASDIDRWLIAPMEWCNAA